MNKSYWSSIAFGSLSESEYTQLKESGMLYEIYPQASGLYQPDMDAEKAREDSRKTYDAMVYQDEEALLWPYNKFGHDLGDTYAEKIEKLYDVQKDDMFIDDYSPSISKEDVIISELEVIQDSLKNITKLLKGE